MGFYCVKHASDTHGTPIQEAAHRPLLSQGAAVKGFSSMGTDPPHGSGGRDPTGGPLRPHLGPRLLGTRPEGTQQRTVAPCLGLSPPPPTLAAPRARGRDNFNQGAWPWARRETGTLRPGTCSGVRKWQISTLPRVRWCQMDIGPLASRFFALCPLTATAYSPVPSSSRGFVPQTGRSGNRSSVCKGWCVSSPHRGRGRMGNELTRAR